MKYRPEIDGLRSVAVLPVILFHAGFSLFSGGYVGVDVFFVISGYLITTILISEREAGTYSLLGFYERRARRILPALFVMMICTIPFAWQWIPPDPFEDYARSLSYAALFISNIHFLEKSSYFDVGAEFRPLLHTWSLAVEEQYYLLFPLVLWALGQFVRAKFLIVFLVLSALSLALAEWGWRNYPTENFFFSPSRLWELLAGSICAAILFRRAQMRSEVGALAGLALIVYSVIFYDATLPFPSVYTLVPVLGTVLIILFAAPGTITARLLSVKPMVGIGLISYSAYLWHQPLFVFARFRSVAEPSHLLMGALAIASLVLAWLTWRYVETPFRRRTFLAGRKPLLTASVAGILAFAVFGTWGDLSKGFPVRLEAKMTPELAVWRTQRGERRKEDVCGFNDDRDAKAMCVLFERDTPKARIAVVGDSHAQSILPAFERLSEASNVTVLRGIRAACPPLLGTYLVSGGADAISCNAYAQRVADHAVQEGVDTVFIVSRWSLYARGDYSGQQDVFAVADAPGKRVRNGPERLAEFEASVARTVSFYRQAGIRVILVAQVPQQLILPDNLLAQAVLQGLTAEEARTKFAHSFVKRDTFDDFIAETNRILERVAAEHGAEIVSLNDYFVADEHYAWFMEDKVLFRDADHLSLEGAFKVAPSLIETFDAR